MICCIQNFSGSNVNTFECFIDIVAAVSLLLLCCDSHSQALWTCWRVRQLERSTPSSAKCLQLCRAKTRP